MGSIHCHPQDVALVAAVARDFCPFPDFSPSPLLNILQGNSSELLTEHYVKVQASLSPQQQQDFTRSLRDTFGREGKVSYGGLGIVALSLAVLFDTVARQVKGETVSDHQPVPGLFLKDPRGTYPPPVYTVSQYLRLVPNIANNPSRMRDETEKYLHELYRAGTQAVESISKTQLLEDITSLNLVRCALLGKIMYFHLKLIANKTVEDDRPLKKNGDDTMPIFNFNCDPEKAGGRLLTELASFDNRTRESFKKCDLDQKDNTTVLRDIARLEWLFKLMLSVNIENEPELAKREDFDLKAKALGKWI